MGKTIEKDGFKVEVFPGKLRVANLDFSAGESTRLTGLISLAGQMASMKALPPSIGHSPFVIAFNNTGNHLLHREGTDSGVWFKINQTDALVGIINHGVEAHKNQLNVQSADRLRNRGNIRAPGVNAPDIIDGRG